MQVFVCRGFFVVRIHGIFATFVLGKKTPNERSRKSIEFY